MNRNDGLPFWMNNLKITSTSLLITVLPILPLRCVKKFSNRIGVEIDELKKMQRWLVFVRERPAVLKVILDSHIKA